MLRWTLRLKSPSSTSNFASISLHRPRVLLQVMSLPKSISLIKRRETVVAVACPMKPLVLLFHRGFTGVALCEIHSVPARPGQEPGKSLDKIVTVHGCIKRL